MEEDPPDKNLKPKEKTRKKRVVTNASAILDTNVSFISSETDNSRYIGFPPNATYEEQLIIRFPHDLVSDIRSSLAQGIIHKDMNFEFTDERHGFVTFRGKKYTVALVDLPCIIESHKTIDKKQFYKIADICQMLIVSHLDGPLITNTVWPNGLTKPMTFVRKRRFRKRAVKRADENIELTVQRLIEADLKAIDVHRELKNAGPSEGESQLLAEGQADDDEQTIEDDQSDDSGLAAEIEFGLLENNFDGQMMQSTSALMSDEEAESELAMEDFMADEGSLQSESKEMNTSSPPSSFDFSFLQNKFHSKMTQLKESSGDHAVKKRFGEALQLLSQKMGHRGRVETQRQDKGPDDDALNPPEED